MRPLPRSRYFLPSASKMYEPSPRTMTGATRLPWGSHGLRTYLACLAWSSADDMAPRILRGGRAEVTRAVPPAQAMDFGVCCTAAMPKKLLAIDQGTTGSTAIVLTLEGATLGKKTVEF